MYRLLVVLCLSAVYAQLEVNGTCDLSKINYVKNVPLGIAGTWYQIQRIPNSVENGDCAHTNITIAIDNTSMSGNKYDSEVANGKLVLRTATINSTSELGVWKLTYNDGRTQNIVALGTDYIEYLVLYSCQNIGSTSSKISAWKLGRSTTYSANAMNATNALAASANIANTTWKVVQHSAAHCALTGGAGNPQISPVLFLLLASIGLAKGL